MIKAEQIVAHDAKVAADTENQKSRWLRRQEQRNRRNTGSQQPEAGEFTPEMLNRSIAMGQLEKAFQVMLYRSQATHLGEMPVQLQSWIERTRQQLADTRLNGERAKVLVDSKLRPLFGRMRVEAMKMIKQETKNQPRQAEISQVLLSNAGFVAEQMYAAIEKYVTQVEKTAQSVVSEDVGASEPTGDHRGLSFWQKAARVGGAASAVLPMGAASLPLEAEHHAIMIDEKAALQAAVNAAVEDVLGEMLLEGNVAEPSEQTQIGTAVVKADNPYINFRLGPGTNFADIGDIPAGTSLIVYEHDRSTNWYMVDFNGQVGWVFGPLVEYTALPAPATPEGSGDTATDTPVVRATEVPVVNNVELTTRQRWDKEEIEKLLPGGTPDLMLQNARERGIINIQYNPDMLAYQGELNGETVYFYGGLGTERGRDGSYIADDLADGWVGNGTKIRSSDFKLGKKGLEINFELSLNHPKYGRITVHPRIDQADMDKLSKVLLTHFPKAEGSRIVIPIAAGDITPHVGQPRDKDEGIGFYSQWNLAYGETVLGFTKLWRVSLPDRQAAAPDRYDEDQARRTFTYDAIRALIYLLGV